MTIHTKLVVVTNIESRSVSGGKYTAWDVYTASGEKFGAGLKKPTLIVGQTYEFDYEVGKYGPDIKFARPTSGHPAIPIAPVTPSSGSASAGGSITSGSTTSDPMKPIARDPFQYQNGARPFPLPLLHGDRAFVRKDALTLAVGTVGTGTLSMGAEATSAAEIIDLARVFEGYLAGDTDGQAAEAILAPEAPLVPSTVAEKIAAASKARVKAATPAALGA